MEEKFVQLNIAFRVPEEVAKVAMKLSEEIAEKEDAYFVLDGVNYLFHITNYSVDVLEKNVEKMFEIIEKLAEDFSPVEFVFNKRINANLGWICVFFDCSQEIKNLHEAIVNAVSPLKKGQTAPSMADSYDPHVTITRLKDFNIAKKVASEMKWEIEKFKSDAIGIFVSGEHGTCAKLLKEFKFRK